MDFYFTGIVFFGLGWWKYCCIHSALYRLSGREILPGLPGMWFLRRELCGLLRIATGLYKNKAIHNGGFCRFGAVRSAGSGFQKQIPVSRSLCQSSLCILYRYPGCCRLWFPHFECQDRRICRITPGLWCPKIVILPDNTGIWGGRCAASNVFGGAELIWFGPIGNEGSW